MGFATEAREGGPREEGLVEACLCYSGDLEEVEIGRRIFQLTGHLSKQDAHYENKMPKTAHHRNKMLKLKIHVCVFTTRFTPVNISNDRRGQSLPQ
jgi:hypothetical protein